MAKRRRTDLAHLSSYSREYKTLWQRIKRGGGSMEEWLAKNKEKANRTCIVPGCPRKFHSKGYCHNHYHRYHSYGNPRIGDRSIPYMPAKQYFNDLPEKNVRVCHSILRNLGKGYDR